VALAQVPVETIDHARSRVAFEVGEGEDPRRVARRALVAPVQQRHEQTLLRVVGP
jgi:hypothetical protein